MGFALKHIFERDMLPYLHEIAPLLKVLDKNDGHDFIGVALQFVAKITELSIDIIKKLEVDL